MAQQFDLIVVGGGPGGYEVAAHCASKGQKVLLVEKDRPGGTCLNRGCIPTKCLCASAALIDRIAGGKEFGVDAESVTLSYSDAARRMREVVDRLREGVGSILAGCTVLNGEASITPDGNVAVDSTIYSAPRIIIATGSRPAQLPVEGDGLALTSDDFLEMSQLPKSAVIVGGGVIALEIASIMNSFGTDVTIIEYCKEILPQFDADVAKRLRSLMSRKGVKFVVGASVTALRQTGDRYRVDYTDRRGNAEIITDRVFMAVGRQPVVPAGIAEAGILTDSRGFIVTDKNMQTTRDGVYAVGDCNGRVMLAHMATAQAMAAIGEQVDMDVFPSAVFTNPEVAMTGMTEEQCRQSGICHATAKAMFAANGKAVADGVADGFVKLVYHPETGVLLGCHILGEHASDIVQQAVVAISQKMTVGQLGRKVVFGHPTLSEVLRDAALSAAQKLWV